MTEVERRFEAGQPVKQIAAELGLSERVVYTAVRALRAELKKQLEAKIWEANLETVSYAEVARRVGCDKRTVAKVLGQRTSAGRPRTYDEAFRAKARELRKTHSQKQTAALLGCSESTVCAITKRRI